MNSLVWIAFDLGIRGDYEAPFQFFDWHDAKECGDSLALIRFEWTSDLLAELQAEIAKSVKFDKRSRVNAIYPNANGNYAGRFIVGSEKSPLVRICVNRTGRCCG